MPKITELIPKFFSFILMLVVAAFLFAALLYNHANDLDLENYTISVPAIKKMYPELYPDIQSVKSGSSWYYAYKHYIYKDDLPWQQCESEFVGVQELGNKILLICSKEILLFDKYEKLLDKMDEAYGLPVPIDRTGAVGGQLFVEIESKFYNVDLNSMEIFQAVSDKNIKWQVKASLPHFYKNIIFEENGVNLKTLLDGLFNKFFSGLIGKLLIDMLLLFAFFTLYAFFKSYFLEKNDLSKEYDEE